MDAEMFDRKLLDAALKRLKKSPITRLPPASNSPPAATASAICVSINLADDATASGPCVVVASSGSPSV